MIQLVQTMRQTKKKQNKKKKQQKGKVGKARGSSVIKTLKGFLTEFQLSRQDPETPTLKSQVGS